MKNWKDYLGSSINSQTTHFNERARDQARWEDYILPEKNNGEIILNKGSNPKYKQDRDTAINYALEKGLDEIINKHFDEKNNCIQDGKYVLYTKKYQVYIVIAIANKIKEGYKQGWTLLTAYPKEKRIVDKYGMFDKSRYADQIAIVFENKIYLGNYKLNLFEKSGLTFEVAKFILID